MNSNHFTFSYILQFISHTDYLVYASVCQLWRNEIRLLNWKPITSVHGVVNTAEMVDWAIEAGCPRRFPLFTAAAIRRDFNMMKYIADRHNIDWHRAFTICAILSCDVEIMDWCYENGNFCYSIDLVENIVRERKPGYKEVIAWLNERNFDIKKLDYAEPDIIEEPLYNYYDHALTAIYHRDIADLIVDLPLIEDVNLSDGLYREAAAQEDIEIIEIINIYFPDADNVTHALTQAVEMDNIPLAQSIFQLGCILDSTLYNRAIQNHSITMLEWLLEIECPINREVYISAYEEGQIHILDWLFQHGFEIIHDECMVDAIVAGNLDSIKWLVSLGYQLDDRNLYTAIYKCNIEIMNWILESTDTIFDMRLVNLYLTDLCIFEKQSSYYHVLDFFQRKEPRAEALTDWFRNNISRFEGLVQTDYAYLGLYCELVNSIKDVTVDMDVFYYLTVRQELKLICRIHELDKIINEDQIWAIFQTSLSNDIVDILEWMLSKGYTISLEPYIWEIPVQALDVLMKFEISLSYTNLESAVIYGNIRMLRAAYKYPSEAPLIRESSIDLLAIAIDIGNPNIIRWFHNEKIIDLSDIIMFAVCTSSLFVLKIFAREIENDVDFYRSYAEGVGNDEIIAWFDKF